MWDIMKALIDARTACEEHGTTLDWFIEAEPGGELVLRANIPITEDDQRYVEDMRALLGPA